MKTYFAPAGRADPGALELQIELASGSPVAEGLVQTADGLVAVLNSDLQIVSLNETFLAFLGRH